jgi:predicted GIY-YIG superfamily endonuclease
MRSSAEKLTDYLSLQPVATKIRMTTNIYVLELEGGRYYVGKSDNPMQRYMEHLEGRGSVWTRQYRPKRVVKILEDVSSFEEDKVTKEYMARYGMDKVRGGAYVTSTLTDEQREVIQREIWASTDCCTTCGRKGHFAANCYALTDINGNELKEDESDYDTEEESDKDSDQDSDEDTEEESDQDTEDDSDQDTEDEDGSEYHTDGNEEDGYDEGYYYD